MGKIVLKIGVALLLVVGTFAVTAGWFVSDRWGSDRGVLDTLTRREVNEKVALSILRSEALSFLVTRRTASQIVVQHEESDLLGAWNGVLWATVRWTWGVDLTKIKESDIRRDGAVVVVRLPEPELLDFSTDLESIGFISRSTALPKLAEVVNPGRQRQTLERRVKEEAMKFAQAQKLTPSREEIVRQLNDAASVIQASADLELRFE